VISGINALTVDKAYSVLETGNPGPDLVNTNSIKDWSEMSAGEGAVSNFSRTRAGLKLDKDNDEIRHSISNIKFLISSLMNS